MKISIICTEFPPNYRGGLGVYIDRVTRQLKTDRHELTLYTLNYPYTLPKVEQQDNLTINRITPCNFTKRGLDATRGKLSLKAIAYNALNLAMFNWHTFRKLWREHRKGDIGTLAVHDWMCIPAALLLNRLTRKSLVFHVHSTEMSMNLHGTNGFTPKVAAWLENQIGKVATRVIAPSEEIKDFLVSQGWASQKIEVVHHGYEDERLKAVYESTQQASELAEAEFRKSIHADKNTKILVFAGRLITHKGVTTLIDSMPSIVARHPNTKLVLVGSGEQSFEHNMQQQIDTLGLNDHIHAYYQQMPQEDVVKHYSFADICIFPSTYEPFGFVALEAMSLSKPVVLGCGFPSVIKAPESKGLLAETVALHAECDKADELAKHIISLLDQPDWAMQLGQRAKQYVSHQFRWAKTSKETLAVYKECENA